MNQLTKYGLFGQLRNSISEFADTLELTKKILKKGNGVENFKQDTLIRLILQVDFDAPFKNFTRVMLAVSSSKVVFKLSYYASLDPLLKAKAISSKTLKKLVHCSLSLSKVMCIHKRDPHNGLRTVFSEYIEGSKSP